MKSLPSRSHNFLFACNLLCICLLLGALTITYEQPAYLERCHLNPVTGRMLCLNLISLSLLLAYIQRNLTPGWRRFSLACSFVILAESWLVAFF